MKKAILVSLGMLCLVALSRAQSPTIFDDAVQGTGLNQHNYVGAGWVHGSSTPSFHNSTLSYSHVAGAYVTFTFIGNKVEWATEKKSTHGITAVSIDGGPETTIDLYAPNEVHTIVYSSQNLTQGTHTFKIRATGTKNPASTGYYAIHDFVIISQEVTPAKPDITNTYTGNGAMAYFDNHIRYNSAFGYSALNSVLQAQANTAIGSRALQFVGKAYLNTAVGSDAMSHGVGTLNDGNTAIGSNALNVGQPGALNTAIGSSSGPAQGSPFFVYTTAIGAGATTTADYQVRIGNPAVTSIGGQ
ncbi:MAG TPA: hypothetical protein VJ184_02615, partial [Chryseolinea sp.]|nr:hypothetical protein [Chryseolinea sp.]